MSKKQLLFFVNTTSFFLSHRLPIAQAALSAGYDVHVATGTVEDNEELVAHGFVHHHIPLTRSGIQLIDELKSLWAILKLMRTINPSIVHLVTIKPVLYGGIAARLAGVEGVVAAISGLGMLFTDGGSKKRLIRVIVSNLYQFALGHKNIKVVFQNSHDREVISHVCKLSESKAVLIPGSGVAMKDYPYTPDPNSQIITFAARLIKDKGVYEFIQAARILKQRGLETRFLVVGAIDPDNPNSVSNDEIKTWQKEGIVDFLGYRNDIADIFSKSNIVCLPSYYGEGLPKVLIEAAACGRAVVTTDHPGCRDAVIDGTTGMLVPVKNSKELANTLENIIKSPPMRQEMGRAGRDFAERVFTIESVVERHLTLYRELSSQSSR
jgi:glycosyltransferase involved in cell wall biosynthesis